MFGVHRTTVSLARQAHMPRCRYLLRAISCPDCVFGPVSRALEMLWFKFLAHASGRTAVRIVHAVMVRAATGVFQLQVEAYRAFHWRRSPIPGIPDTEVVTSNEKTLSHEKSARRPAHLSGWRDSRGLRPQMNEPPASLDAVWRPIPVRPVAHWPKPASVAGSVSKGRTQGIGRR